MDIDFEKVTDFVKALETLGIGEHIKIYARLVNASLTIEDQPSLPEGVLMEDPEKRPNEAARYFSISWDTFRDRWIERYSIKCNGKKGSARRFRLSELMRVQELREKELEE